MLVPEYLPHVFDHFVFVLFDEFSQVLIILQLLQKHVLLFLCISLLQPSRGHLRRRELESFPEIRFAFSNVLHARVTVLVAGLSRCEDTLRVVFFVI